MIDKLISYLEQDKLEEALEIVLTNDFKYKEDIEFINLKGILCIKSHEYSTAISILKQGLNIDEYNLDVNYNLAYAYAKIDDMYMSLKTYNKVLQISNNDEKQEIIELLNSDMYKQQVYTYLNRLVEKKNFEEIEEFILNKPDVLDIDIKYLTECLNNAYIEDLGNEFNYGETKVINTYLKHKFDTPKDIFESREQINSNKERPLVSISILAYNKLEEYTKKCVESVLKYSEGIDYELILVDNGSTDGTYEYFKTVCHDKKKIIKITKNLGVGYPTYEIFNEMNGKYIMCLPNDIIVTENWLSNMVKCAESDERIGMINPVLDNVTNNQSINLQYENVEDMQKKAAIYNKSDCRKWHERLKLITLGSLFRKSCIDVIGITDYGFIHHYADDDITFRVRRAGYKAILCKDTFISHIGKASDKGLDIEDIGMRKGNEFFEQKYYGINFNDVMNYEINLISLIDEDEIKKNEYKVLGIETLCGTPILEVKNKLREKGKFNTSLYGFSTEAKYWIDLNTICNDVKVDRIEYINENYSDKFDYIVIGKCLNEFKDINKLVKDLSNILDEKGSILLKLKNTYEIKTLLHILGIYINDGQSFTKNIDINGLNKILNNNGLYIENITGELSNFSLEDKEYIDTLLKNMNISQDIVSNMYIDNYLLKIKKLLQNNSI
ncbi:glycosyltransferase [Paraclostridium sordellii]|uniref:glycosyltransferase n=1 Tax=Paraclostridium sordellii TaxID=1505 RepID=UPI000386DB57|nr:glycosyltransferase [Paeniclostridium sordellii]EPZ59847.1 glycosyl transferase 2 family protein [[Clostridium] sordellii VPI 9048] [Paeniclostridium sordellii VPI 9048]CEK39037.1 putative CRISPR-associated ATP-dependent helicase [[Clostridium] sordellii] [Paeniclostridium sordellii]